MPNIGPFELIAMLMLVILSIGIPVAILFLVVRAAARSAFGRDRRLEADLGAQVIRERFGRGEIPRDDAEAGMRALGRDLGGPA